MTIGGEAMHVLTFRWAAISGLLFLILVIVGFALTISVDPYESEIANLLADIDENKTAFQAGAVAAAAAMLFLVPLIIGVMYTHLEQDRPFGTMASLFFVISVAGSVIGGISAVVLGEVASEYAGASGAVKEALEQDGNLVQSFYVMASGPAAFFPLGLALALTGVLMLRARFFARPIAWLTLVVAVGGLSGGFLWPVVIIGVPLWTIAVAWTLWSKASETPALATAGATP
jgi:hypothetical protein